MLRPRTLSIYVAREILLYATLCFVAVTTVLLSQQLLERLDELVSGGLNAGDQLVVLRVMLAMLATYAVPIAFAMGAILAIGRLAADREVLAMRACGLGLRQLALPTLAVAGGITILNTWLLFSVEHRARLQLRETFTFAAARGAMLQPGIFRGVGERMVFIQERDRDGRISGVMIYDRSDAEQPFLIFAENGRIDFDEASGSLELLLESGDVLLDPEGLEPERVQSIAFDESRYAFAAHSLLHEKTYRRKPEELSLTEIAEVLRKLESGESLEGLRVGKRQAYDYERHRRAALAIVPLIFGTVAVPLGLLTQRSSRSFALVLSGALGLAYYGVFTFGRIAARDGMITPLLGAWGANVLLAIAGLALLRRAVRGIDP